MDRTRGVAVFIDREGVINTEVRHPDLKDAQGREITGPLVPDEFNLFPDVVEAFDTLHAAGLQTVIISNQVNVAKGHLTKDALSAITDRLTDLCAPNAVYYCTHHEDYTGPCECKKPKDGMLRQAAREHGYDIARSYMVGDRRIDMQTGAACKRCFYVASRDGEDPAAEVAKLPEEIRTKVTIVKDLAEAARLIIQETGERHDPSNLREAIIPCAGRGTSMGDLVQEIPKPMLPFDGMPFLRYIIAFLKDQGVTRFIIPVGYLGHVIKGYFGDGSRFGVEIEYVHSSVEVESGGSFKRALRHLRGTDCLMQYGDSFLPVDLIPYWDRLREQDADASIICSKRPLPLKEFESKNNIIVDDDGNMIGYDKKDALGKATLLDTGVNLYSRRVLSLCPSGTFKLSDTLFPMLAIAGKTLTEVSPVKSVGIGNPDKIARFEKFLETNDLRALARALGPVPSYP